MDEHIKKGKICHRKYLMVEFEIVYRRRSGVKHLPAFLIEFIHYAKL